MRCVSTRFVASGTHFRVLASGDQSTGRRWSFAAIESDRPEDGIDGARMALRVGGHQYPTDTPNALGYRTTSDSHSVPDDPILSGGNNACDHRYRSVAVSTGSSGRCGSALYGCA